VCLRDGVYGTGKSPDVQKYESISNDTDVLALFKLIH